MIDETLGNDWRNARRQLAKRQPTIGETSGGNWQNVSLRFARAE